jgi:hypothetical protein
MKHNLTMSKTAILPQVRVDPELRAQAEAALLPGEKLSDLVETAVRRVLEHRAVRQTFEAHSRDSLEHFRATGEAHSTADVLGELRRCTQARREELIRQGKTA